MKYQYLLLIIGVVLIIAGLWLSYRKPVLEGLADTSLVMLIGSTGSNLYYADQGLTNSPNWATVGGSITQMSGSLGRLIGVNGTSVSYGTQYNIPGSAYTWVSVPGAMSQVSFEYPFVVGVDPAGLIKYIDDITTSPTTATWRQNSGELASKTFKWVSTSLGRAYAIGTDNSIWYVNNVRTGSWLEVTGSIAGKIFTQIAFDANQVLVLDSANNVYYADSNYSTDTSLVLAPTWTPLPGAMKQISLTNNMAVGVGADNNVYFASNAKVGNWNTLSKPTGFIFVEIMYPTGANMITGRPADVAPCTNGYSFYNGYCRQPCPNGYTTNQFICTGIPITRSSRAATIVPPTYYTCPTEFDVNLTGAATCKTIVGGTLAIVSPVKEVFSVAGSYSQMQAQDKCLSYGAALATTGQITSAQGAGADWCTGGWVSDNNSAILYPRGGCEAGASGVISAPIVDGLAPANCYGVKPPQNQFIDIKPFKTTGAWNQVMQCPVGYNVNTTGACNSTCPSGSWGKAGSCVFPVISKDFTPASLVNYTCPVGYDSPSVVMCSGSTCGPPQTCYSTCPSGSTPSGESCAGAITAKKTAQAMAPVITGVTCPAGQTLSGTTCYATCNVGDTNVSATQCSNTVMTKIGALSIPKTTTYDKVTSAATITYGPYTCAVGWSLTNLTCYQNCPAGTTDIVNNQCQAIGSSRNTTQATYTAPCPPGATLSNGKCYLPCQNGTTEIDAMNCQAPSVARTTATPNAIKSSLTPCNSTEETFTGETSQTCEPLCPTGYITSQTSCTPPTITRTNYPAKYSCNSNETLQNGVCVSKCPEGTYPNGELCMADEQIVPVPTSIKCTSTPYLKGKKWMCDKQADADALLKDPSETTTYVGAADQVCVSDDSTTGMYFCQSGAEAKDNTGAIDTIRKSYTNTCAAVKKNYLDLSGTLTSLTLIQDGMSNGATQLTTAQTALRTIYSQLNCASPPNAQVTTLCNQIQAGATAIGQDSTNINSVLMNITVPIQAALASRSSLLASIKNFQCDL